MKFFLYFFILVLNLGSVCAQDTSKTSLLIQHYRSHCRFTIRPYHQGYEREKNEEFYHPKSIDSKFIENYAEHTRIIRRGETPSTELKNSLCKTQIYYYDPRTPEPISDLRFLAITNNEIYTNIFNIITQFPNLEYLGLPCNMITGSISESIGSLHKLKYIDLFCNTLTTFPGHAFDAGDGHRSIHLFLYWGNNMESITLNPRIHWIFEDMVCLNGITLSSYEKFENFKDLFIDNAQNLSFGFPDGVSYYLQCMNIKDHYIFEFNKGDVTVTNGSHTIHIVETGLEQFVNIIKDFYTQNKAAMNDNSDS